MDAKVEVRGLKELSGAFRRVDSELPNEMKASFRAIVERVIGDIRPEIPTITGKAAGSLKPRATAKGAGIAFGGTAAPYYPWLDFGGRVGRKKAIVRPVAREGRYVYPGIRRNRDLIIHEVNEAIERTAEKAGFETRGSD